MRLSDALSVIASLGAVGEEIGQRSPEAKEEKPIPEYQLRQRAFEDAMRPRLIADSRTIRANRLELRRGLPDGRLFVRRPERAEIAGAVRTVRKVAR